MNYQLTHTARFVLAVRRFFCRHRNADVRPIQLTGRLTVDNTYCLRAEYVQVTRCRDCGHVRRQFWCSDEDAPVQPRDIG